MPHGGYLSALLNVARLVAATSLALASTATAFPSRAGLGFLVVASFPHSSRLSSRSEGYFKQRQGLYDTAFYPFYSGFYGGYLGYSGVIFSETAFPDQTFAPAQTPPAPQNIQPQPPISEAEINAQLDAISNLYGPAPSAPAPDSDAAINAQLASISQAYATSPAPTSRRPPAAATASVRLSGFLPGTPLAQAEKDRHLHRYFSWREDHILILADDDLSPPPPGAFLDSAPDGDTFDPSVVAQVQRVLHIQGYYAGPANGAVDPGFRRSIGDYQVDHRLAPSGVIDEATLASMGLLRGVSFIDEG